jgi:uncharacterized protein
LRVVGLISDTHSYLDPAVFEHFKNCDEIWHAGDIGDEKVLKALEQFKPTTAVFGNIDEVHLQKSLEEYVVLEREGLKICMIHIGAIPPTYSRNIRLLLEKTDCDLFICGHSHILRVIKDDYLKKRVYINPGAAGKQGFHRIRTIMRLYLENGKVSNLEVIELGLK